MYNNSLFESIKESLNKPEKVNNASYKDIMKTEVGKTYIVRLLPSADPKKTFFEHYMQGFTSFATGQYIQTLSPATFGERDPISEARFKLLKMGSEEDKKKAETVRRTQKWLVNVLVIEDPTNPENKGKVKMLKYGKQLQKVIDAAINGEDAAEFGSKVFDLTPNGVNLKIKVEEQGGYPNYASSRFTSASDLKLTSEEIEKTYSSVFELDKVNAVKSYDELVALFDTHFYCKGDAKANNTQPAGNKKTAVVEESRPEETEIAADPEPISDADVAKLLEGIDID